MSLFAASQVKNKTNLPQSFNVSSSLGSLCLFGRLAPSFKVNFPSPNSKNLGARI